jgi:hypothetical protein
MAVIAPTFELYVAGLHRRGRAGAGTAAGHSPLGRAGAETRAGAARRDARSGGGRAGIARDAAEGDETARGQLLRLLRDFHGMLQPAPDEAKNDGGPVFSRFGPSTPARRTRGAGLSPRPPVGRRVHRQGRHRIRGGGVTRYDVSLARPSSHAPTAPPRELVMTSMNDEYRLGRKY